MFWRLALKNVKRNYNRTLLGIVGMFVAAALIAGSGAMQSGFPSGNNLGYRRAAGGDLLAFPERLTVSEQAVTDSNLTWTLDLHPAENSVLSELLPDADRLLVPKGASGGLFRLDDLPAAITAAGAQVYPYLAMPALLTVSGPDGRPQLTEVILRGRDPLLDRTVYDLANPAFISGRYLDAADGAAPVAVANTFAPPLADLLPGNRATLTVPTIRGVAGDEIIYDFTAPSPITLDVVGRIKLATYTETALDADGRPIPKAPEVQRYWERPEIFVTADCWRAIHAQVAGGQPIYTGQIGLVTADSANARTLARSLSGQLTGSVVTVPDLVAAAAGQRGQLALPRDMTGLLTVLVCLVAGLLMAGNVSVLVSQRRQELGALKAIGMTPSEVFRLILLEIAGFSLIGAGLGFLSMRLFVAIFAYAVSHVPFATALQLTGAAFARTAILTLSTVLVFGVGPAYAAARAPVMEVLHHE